MNSLNLTYQSALAQHQAGDVAQAEGLYNEVLANDPGHMDAIFNLAVLLASQNRTNEAIPLYELVLEVLPDDPDTLSNMGNAYTNTGQLEQAMDCYQRAIEGNPLLSAAHINLGNLFFQQGHTDQAIERYHEAISIDPSAANAHNNLGTILLAAGRRDEAKASYQAALKYDADNPETLKNYGNILLSFGEIEDAADIMRQVVAIAPNWAPAQADLGLTLMRLDDFVPAREALERAVALEPTFIEAWNCLGNLLHLMELHDDCEQTLRQALQVEPNNPVTAFHLGTLYFGQTRFEEALTQFARACEFQPDSADYRNSYGNTLLSLQRQAEAIEQYALAIELMPEFGEAHNNMGNCLAALDRRDEAVESYRRSLEINPDQALVACNLGNTLRHINRLAESIEAFEHALKADPNLYNVYNGIGLNLQILNRHGEAVETFKKGLEIFPEYPEGLNNLAISQSAVGDIDGAIKTYGKLLEISPDLAEGYFNLASLLQSINRWDESIMAFMQALRVRPEYSVIYPYLAHSLMQQCSWSNLHSVVEKIRTNTEHELAIGNPVAVSAFALQSLPGEFSMALRLSVAKQISERNANYVAYLHKKLNFNFNRGRQRKRIRVGYVSPDFRFHSVSVAFKGILDNHDTDRIEAYGYAAHSAEDDHMTNALRERFHGYRQMNGQPFEVSAQQIYDDGIDILVDLAGHTKGGQLSLLALKPAPIQAHYLGYSATIGASYLDYLITDHHQVPEEQRQYFSENLVYLPDTFMATQRAPVAIDAFTRAQCGLPEDAFVFANFNTHYKIEPRMFAIWMRLLRKIPKAVLWLVRGTNSSADNLRREASARGVAPERLIFADKVLHPVHLARLANADLALDNYYHGGGVTTVDCLWMGLPVLTLAGPTPQSRNGATLLSAIGREDMIQHRIEDYEAMAFDLAENPTKLANIKAEMTAKRDQYPLFNSKRLTQHLESGYEMMWETYQKGEQPRMIDIPHLPD
ncbi:MAG: tetratricopeptide repeat protein [Rhodospirillaceae bacterium]|nr:tetratricopeptide repeat protein [Rhodospirillaceae bacterium]MBT7287240.1 tetratricopeptide repeat protein [Rhodospirillaceae bacterium]